MLMLFSLFSFRAGYLANYEINQIISQSQDPDLYGNMSILQYEDEGDVLIYNDTNWVSWLSPTSYASRQNWLDGLNFGGTSDWAIDLNKTYDYQGNGDPDDGFGGADYEICDFSLTFQGLDDLSAAAGNMRSDCIAAYTLQVLIDMLDTAYNNYTNVSNGYDDLFGYYVTYIGKLVPAILEDNFMWNMSTSGGPDMGTGALPNVGYGMNCTTPYLSYLVTFSSLYAKKDHEPLTRILPTLIDRFQLQAE